MSVSEGRAILREWLRDDKGCVFLELESKKLVSLVNCFDVPEQLNPFFGLDEDDRLQEARFRLIEAIDSCFSKPVSVKFVEMLARKNFRKILQQIRWRVVSGFKEALRQKKTNSWGYAYRRAREIFTAEDDFFTRSKQSAADSYTFYSLEDDVPYALDNTLFPENKTEYRAWACPEDIVPDQECFFGQSDIPSFRRNHFILLGKLFWKDALTRLGGKYFLPVREFIHYLSAFYYWLQPSAPASFVDVDIENRLDPSPFPDDPSALTGSGYGVLARQLTDNWIEMERVVCYYKYFYKEKMSDVKLAGELDTTRYFIKQADDKIRSQLEKFCHSFLPGPGMAERDRDDALCFLEEVRKICRKYNQDRIHRLKGVVVNE